MGRLLILGGCVMLAVAACGDDGGSDDEGSGGAMGTGATGGGSGGNMGMCPDNPSPVTNCAGPCPVVSDQLAMICTVTCCTANNTCGTRNSAANTQCSEVTGQDNSSCPDEMIAGNVAEGCCADGVKCGVVDTITNSGCVARDTVPLVTLAPINCDGSMPPAGGM